VGVLATAALNGLIQFYLCSAAVAARDCLAIPHPGAGSTHPRPNCSAASPHGRGFAAERVPPESDAHDNAPWQRRRKGSSAAAAAHFHNALCPGVVRWRGPTPG